MLEAILYAVVSDGLRIRYKFVSPMLHRGSCGAEFNSKLTLVAGGIFVWRLSRALMARRKKLVAEDLAAPDVPATELADR